MSNEALYNQLNNDRLASRQLDELIGLARGLCADGILNESEVAFLQSWLAANMAASDQPLLQTLMLRLDAVLSDGVVDAEEQKDLFETLNSLAPRDFELGEVLKPSTLPLCQPPPVMEFVGRHYVFTGTFSFGQRRDCEKAVIQRGGTVGSLTRQTNFLVVGNYVTDSWKHSSMGNKILKACELRKKGHAISIVSESHWMNFL